MIKLGKAADMSEAVMKERMQRFANHAEKAYKGKLVQNKEVCGFFFLSPRAGKDVTTVKFNSKDVAVISTGEFELKPFDQKVFSKDNKFKYDVLCEIYESVTGNSINEDDAKDEEIVDEDIQENTFVVQKETPKAEAEPATKRKSPKRKRSTPKRK